MGVVTWAAVKCELAARPPTSTSSSPAAELDELVDFAYRLDRIRLGDEVLIVNDAYLARLLEARRRGASTRDALPAWTLVLGLGGREHFAAERVRVQKKDADGAGRRVRPDAAVVDPRRGRPATSPRALAGCCDDAVEAGAPRAPAPTCFFVTTLEEAPAFVEIAHIVADGHGYAAEDVGVYIQPQHQGVTHHVEFSLPYDPADAATARGHAGPRRRPGRQPHRRRRLLQPARTAPGRSPSTTATPPRATPCARSRRSSTPPAS